MIKPFNAEDVCARFCAMPPGNKRLFLAGYAYELTVLARGFFEDEEYEKARVCNETLHLLTGFLIKLIREQGDNSETSFIEMIAADAQQKHWGQLLLGALDRSS